MPRRPRRKGPAGKANLLAPLSILGVIVLGYAAVKFAPPLVTNYQVKQAFTSIAQESARMTDDELRAEIRRRLASIHPPFNVDRDLALTKVGNVMIMDVRYKTVIHHPFYGKQTLHFNPHVEVPITAPATN